MNVTKFDVDASCLVGAVLQPAAGVLQLAFQHDDQWRCVIELPASMRHELAMRILSADGAKVRLNLSWPMPKAIEVECPRCSASPGEKCWGVNKTSRRKSCHTERARHARKQGGASREMIDHVLP